MPHTPGTRTVTIQVCLAVCLLVAVKMVRMRIFQVSAAIFSFFQLHCKLLNKGWGCMSCGTLVFRLNLHDLQHSSSGKGSPCRRRKGGGGILVCFNIKQRLVYWLPLRSPSPYSAGEVSSQLRHFSKYVGMVKRLCGCWDVCWCVYAYCINIKINLHAVRRYLSSHALPLRSPTNCVPLLFV